MQKKNKNWIWFSSALAVTLFGNGDDSVDSIFFFIWDIGCRKTWALPSSSVTFTFETPTVRKQVLLLCHSADGKPNNAPREAEQPCTAWEAPSYWRSARMLEEAKTWLLKKILFIYFIFSVSEAVTCKECLDLDASNAGKRYKFKQPPQTSLHGAFWQSNKRLTQALKCWLTCSQAENLNQLPEEKGNFTSVSA